MYRPKCSFQVALGYSKEYGSDKVRVLTLEKNRGKGGAIRLVSQFWIMSNLNLFSDFFLALFRR